MRNKITIRVYNIAILEYYKNNRDMRLGQFLYNKLDNTGLPFPELFCEQDPKKAKKLFEENYINED